MPEGSTQNVFFSLAISINWLSVNQPFEKLYGMYSQNHQIHRMPTGIAALSYKYLKLSSFYLNIVLHKRAIVHNDPSSAVPLKHSKAS